MVFKKFKGPMVALYCSIKISLISLAFLGPSSAQHNFSLTPAQCGFLPLLRTSVRAGGQHGYPAALRPSCVGRGRGSLSRHDCPDEVTPGEDRVVVRLLPAQDHQRLQRPEDLPTGLRGHSPGPPPPPPALIANSSNKCYVLGRGAAAGKSRLLAGDYAFHQHGKGCNY